jgi:hypothetical protein
VEASEVMPDLLGSGSCGCEGEARQEAGSRVRIQPQFPMDTPGFITPQRTAVPALET